jgi:hypothetical protein
MSGHLTNVHLTSDQLLDRLYGLGEAEGETHLHLRECAGCADRMRAFERRRAEATVSPEAPAELLAAQRRGVYARLEQGPQAHSRWAPALAAACALAVLFWAYPVHHARPQAPNRPAPIVAQGVARGVAQGVAHSEVSDEQLFSDVYSMEQSDEPRAAVPMHALFEDAAEGEQ